VCTAGIRSVSETLDKPIQVKTYALSKKVRQLTAPFPRRRVAALLSRESRMERKRDLVFSCTAYLDGR
jgi:hypothetical protein